MSQTRAPRVVTSISVGQTCPVKGDVEANLEEHVRLTQVAASAGSQIVVFPES